MTDFSTSLAPRVNPADPTDTGPISGQDFIKLRNTHLKFYFPGMPHGTPQTLYVRHSNSIKWNYTLNTNVQSTYGGEVIQILSCFAGPITISGQVTDHYEDTSSGPKFVSAGEELQKIYYWFRNYMIAAGGVGKSVIRDEQSVHFSYPDRGWNMLIQPTGLSGFKYGTTQLAQEWSIVAEIVTDNDLNYFAQTTMAAFTDTEVPRAEWSSFKFGQPDFTGLDSNGNVVTLGAQGDPRTDPTVQGNAMVSSDYSKFGDNFQAMLGALNQGTFLNFGFNDLTSASTIGLNATPETLQGQTSGSSSSGSGTITGTSPGGTATLTLADHITVKNVAANQQQLGAINAVLNEGSSLGVSNTLLIAAIETITQESVAGNNVGTFSGAIGLFQQTPGSIWPATGDAATDAAGFYKIAAQKESANPSADAAMISQLTQEPAAQDSQASEYGQWETEATATVAAWTKANTNISKSGGKAGVVAVAQRVLANRLNYPYSEDPHFNTRAETTLFGSLPMYSDCSSFVTLCYKDAGLPDPNKQNFSPLGNTTSLVANGTITSNPQPGDLVFLGSLPTPYHVMLYIGGGQVIQQSDIAEGVNLKSIQLNDSSVLGVYTYPGS